MLDVMVASPTAWLTVSRTADRTLCFAYIEDGDSTWQLMREYVGGAPPALTNATPPLTSSAYDAGTAKRLHAVAHGATG